MCGMPGKDMITSGKDMTTIVVTVADQWMSRFTAVKEKLQSMGMHIEKVMPKLGVISGTTTNIKKLKSVEGVESVNVESSHSLPPSSAKLQ